MTSPVVSPRLIETERLTLYPFSLDHIPDLHQVYSHPEAMRFWDVPPHGDEAESHRILATMQNRPACWWSISLKGNETMIGNVGFIGNPGVPGVGYILHPNYWQQGFMTEALRAILDYGFDNLGISRAELWINEDNLASQRLAETVGFVRRGRFRQKYHHHPSSHDKYVYGLHLDDWRRPRNEAPTPQHHTQFYSLQPILNVADVKATTDYYRDKLSFEVDFLFGDPPNHGQVSQGEWSFERIQIQFSHSDQADGQQWGAALYIHIGPDLDGLCEQYRAAGVTIEREPANQPWGQREFAIRDLNRYLIRFGTPI